MLKVLAFADDLTGALEAGAQFADQGLPALVTIHGPMRSEHPVQVIDTESRHLSSADAAAAVLRFADIHASVIYKKTDSNLRGNIAAELTALQQGTFRRTVAYIPAYPALRRTVKSGHLLVNGIPVHRTEFGNDLLNPVPDSSIQGLLAAMKEVAIYDGETDADVAYGVARALREPATTLIAGPASVAAEIARQLDIPRTPRQPFPRIRRCLIVNGSRHEVSRRQIDIAEVHGVTGTAPDADWRVLKLGVDRSNQALEVAYATGRAVREQLEANPVNGLLIFGGGTAFAVLHAVGCPLLEPIGEVLPGVPVSRIVGRDLLLITKAGGFGDDNVVSRIKHLLNDATN